MGDSQCDCQASYPCRWAAIERLLMKVILLIGIVALCCAGFADTTKSLSSANLVEPLRPYVRQIANELDKISPERKAALAEIAATIAARLGSGKDVNLTFICTHNSRRPTGLHGTSLSEN